MNNNHSHSFYRKNQSRTMVIYNELTKQLEIIKIGIGLFRLYIVLLLPYTNKTSH